MNAVFADCAGFAVQSVAENLGITSENLGITSRQLARAFMSQVGRSIGAYLGLFRVHKASLLQRTEAKIDDIANAVGFHDASHLSRAFLRATGRRPGEFRRRSWYLSLAPPLAVRGSQS